MFSRFIDDSYAPVVRDNIDRLTIGRLVSNACYRFAPPFIAVIARGLHVSVAEMGVAFMVGEFAGLLSPLVGRAIDRSNRLVAMVTGMAAITGAVLLAAASRNVAMFAAAMFIMSVSKVLFDTSLIVWINDHVPYERRGRVVGVIETSWALSLFIGVALMGAATVLFSWRIGFLVGAAAMTFSATAILRGLPHHDAHAPATRHVKAPIPHRAWWVFATGFLLMAASQCVTITFGPWFEDEFGFTSSALIIVVVVLGLFELGSSVTSARVVDVMGKDVGARRGTFLMAGAGVAMILGAHLGPIAVPAVIIFITGFEFALVCMLPLAANVVPGASGIGLGLTVGAGTCGRAVFSTIATALYDRMGPVAPSVCALALAMAAALCLGAYARSAR